MSLPYPVRCELNDCHLTLKDLDWLYAVLEEQMKHPDDSFRFMRMDGLLDKLSSLDCKDTVYYLWPNGGHPPWEDAERHRTTLKAVRRFLAYRRKRDVKSGKLV